MRIGWIALAWWLLVCATAGAQPVELTGGLDVPLPRPSIAYETHYVPPVANITDFTGEAGQTFALHRTRQPGVWGAVAWFPAKHAGIEARVRYRRATLGGTSGPHRLSLTYTSRQPPDYLPRQHTIESSEARPDPEGHLREWSADLLAVGRFGDARRLQVRVSGGLVLVAISGELQRVVFSHFRMGGHSVISSHQDELMLAFERTWTAAAVGGVDIHHALTPHVGLAAGARVLVPGTADAPARVTNPGETTLPLDAADAQRFLQPPPLRVRPWTLDVLVGLRFSL